MPGTVTYEPFQEYDYVTSFPPGSAFGATQYGYYDWYLAPASPNAGQTTVYSVASTTTATYGVDFELVLYDPTSGTYQVLPSSGTISPSTEEDLYVVGFNRLSGDKVIDVNFNTEYDWFSPIVSNGVITGYDQNIEYYPELLHVTVHEPLGLDIHPLEILANGAPFKLSADGTSESGAGTITVGRTDGISPLIAAAAGTGQYTTSSASITSSGFTANVGGVSDVLWGGGLTIDVPSRTGIITDDGSSGTFELAGLDVTFKKVTINPNSLAFDATFELPVEIGGLTVETAQLSGNQLIFDQSGVHLSTAIDLSTGSTSFNFFNIIPAELTALSADYNSADNSLLLHGKLTIGSLIKSTSGSGFELDFSGDNSIKIDSTGHPSFVGTASITNGGTYGGWGFNNLSIHLDTIQGTASGSLTLTTPFGATLAPGANVTVGVDMNYKPLEVTGLNVTASNLNIEIPADPLFVLQSIGGSLQHFAPSDPAPIVFGGSVGASFGPKINGSSIGSLDLQGTISSEEMTGTATLKLANIDFSGWGFSGSYSALTATGSADFNWNEGDFSLDGKINLLGGLLTASGNLDIDKNWDFSLANKIAFTLPKGIPVLGGLAVADGNLVVEYTNDGNSSNDDVKVWEQVNFSKTILGISYSQNITLGVRFGFDGSVKPIGVGDVPTSSTANATKMADSSMMAEATSQPVNAVAAGQQYILLSADWANSSSDAQLVITMPDGTVLHESDFAAHQIAIVDSLSSDTQRVAIAFAPVAGTWGVAVQGTALGQVDTHTLAPTPPPSLSLDGITANSPSSVTINYHASDADPSAQVSLWYTHDQSASGGTMIEESAAPNGAGSYQWDVSGLAPGEYYVYALESDANNPTARASNTQKLIITAGAAAQLVPVHQIANDFNGDGRSDVLWRNDDGALTDWLGTASGGFSDNSGHLFFNSANGWQVAGTGDFNGDGRVDILFRSSSGVTTDWLGNSDGSFTDNGAQARTGAADNSWAIAGTGDFNGDGKSDILWRNIGSGYLSEWLGTSTGGFSDNAANAASGAADNNWHVASTGDFNGDGKDDILWRNSSGYVTEWLGTSNGGFSDNAANAASGAADNNWVIVGTGDFNGDGHSDILWRHGASGYVTEWLGTANGGFSDNAANAATGAADNTWHIVSIGDFNGDGKDDLLWRNSSGYTTEWLGTSTGGFTDNASNAATGAADSTWHVQDPFL